MKNPKVRKSVLLRNRIKDMKEFIKELHAKNVYIIGRIAVFQDQYLASRDRTWPSRESDGITEWKDYKSHRCRALKSFLPARTHQPS